MTTKENIRYWWIYDSLEGKLNSIRRKGKAERKDCSSFESLERTVGQNLNFHSVNSNYGEKMFKCSIIEAGNYKV